MVARQALSAWTGCSLKAMSRAILSLSVALLVVGSGQAAAEGQESSICVGTVPEKCDVVENGVVQDKFHVKKDDTTNLFQIGEDVDAVTLYVRTKTQPLKKLSMTVVSSEPVARPSLNTNVTGELPVGQTGYAEITFNCKKKSDPFLVNIVFASANPRGLYRVGAMKSCKETQASQDDAVVPGVNIATLDGMKIVERPGGETIKIMQKADVVANGVVSTDYTLGKDGGYKSLKMVGKDATFSEFYLQALKGAGKVTFGVPIVLSESSITKPEISGSAANGGELVPTRKATDALQSLVITYNCQQEGETPVTIRIPTIEPAGTITFSVSKSCANPPESIKDTARRGVSVPGLMVEMGGPEKTVKVIVDGLTQDPFMEDKAMSSRPARISAKQNSAKLSMFMAKEGDGAAEQALEPPIIFVEDSSILETSVQGDAPNLITQNPSDLAIAFSCLSTGTTKVIVTVPLSPATSELKFTFKKVCAPSPIEETANKETAEANKSKKGSVVLDVRTTIKGDADVVVSGTTKEQFTQQYLRTHYAPPLSSTVQSLKKIMESGKLSDDCKECIPIGASTMKELRQGLTKCGVSQRCGEEEMVSIETQNTLVRSQALEKASGESVYEPGVFNADFFLAVPKGRGTVQIGDAEAIALDDKVCKPTLLGPGAAAGTIKERPSKLAVAFGCYGSGGATIVLVKVPIYGGTRTNMLTWAMIKQCAAVNATEFGGTDEENAEMAHELTEVVAKSGAGLNVGTKIEGDESKDVVENGLVMPEFLPAATADNNDAGGYLVSSDQNEISFWLSSAEGKEAEPITVGIPQVVSFNPRICRVHVKEESSLHKGNAVKARFKLEDPLELEVNFECLKTGTAVLAVAIPLSARGGGIHFEFAKECVAEEAELEYKGDLIHGFMVGSLSSLSDVIRNGQVAKTYTRYKSASGPGERKMVGPDTKQVSFFLRMDNDKDGNARTLEHGAPLVIAHKPIVTPEILGLNVSGTLTQTEATLTVRFNCAFEGQTPVSVVLPLPGSKNGGKNEHVIFTVTKKCLTKGGQSVGVAIPLDDGMTLTDHDGDGVLGPEYLDWMEWEDDYYDTMDYLTDYNDYWNTEWAPEDWEWDEEYWWYEDGYDYDYGAFPDAWASDYDADGEDYDGYDPMIEAIANHGWDNSNRLSVGTHEGLVDVIHNGIVTPRYKMCEPEPNVPCEIQALVSQEDATFYISSEDLETLSMPTIRSKYERSVTASVVNADKLVGKVVEPGKPVQLDIHFECLKQGITTPVLVSLTYGYGLHHASFSVVKVCGKRYTTAAVAIETTTVLIGIGVVVSMVLSFLAGRKLKKLRDGRDLSA